MRRQINYFGVNRTVYNEHHDQGVTEILFDDARFMFLRQNSWPGAWPVDVGEVIAVTEIAAGQPIPEGVVFYRVTPEGKVFYGDGQADGCAKITCRGGFEARVLFKFLPGLSGGDLARVREAQALDFPDTDAAKTAAITAKFEALPPLPISPSAPERQANQARPGMVAWERGRFKATADFGQVWFNDEPYDLRARKKAKLCLKYLFERKAFDEQSARDLGTEIDPYVREQGVFPKSAGIKIQHYFAHSPRKRAERLYREIIRKASRAGRYFLKLD